MGKTFINQIQSDDIFISSTPPEQILIQGNCIEQLRNIKDESVDLIVTDPPYKTISGGHNTPAWISGYGNSVLYKNDGKIFDHNNINHEEWLTEAYRVLKEDSHIYIMSNLINLFQFEAIATKVGFKLHNLLVWEKNTCNANRWYMKNCEYILFMRKGKAKSINNASSKTVHQFDNIVGNKQHPTEKPVDLMALYVTNSSNENNIVLDPFMGAGSTGLACLKTNRRFIGIEIDEKYFKVAKDRIKKYSSLNSTAISLQ
jgi:site-specific DNA-methyltransferase (adenine-specific)